MSNKVKVPGGAFYAGDGLTVDQTTRTVSAGGGSSVSTPDWNQNDATASDYIKNRPFYETDPVETVMLPETTVTIALRTDNIISNDFQYSFEIGKNYTIIFDGIETEYTAYNGGGGAVYVGYDVVTVSRGTGYVISANGGKAVLLTMDSSLEGQHTISVKSKQTEIVKIPDKFVNQHTHILERSFWNGRPKSDLIDIVNQFNSGDVFVCKDDSDAPCLLLYANYDGTADFVFVYLNATSIIKITGGVGNWTRVTSSITYS